MANNFEPFPSRLLDVWWITKKPSDSYWSNWNRFIGWKYGPILHLGLTFANLPILAYNMFLQIGSCSSFFLWAYAQKYWAILPVCFQICRKNAGKQMGDGRNGVSICGWSMIFNGLAKAKKNTFYPCKHTKKSGKSPFWIGKLSISMAMASIAM